MSEIEEEIAEELEADTELESDDDVETVEESDDDDATEEEEEASEPDSLSLLVARDKQWDRVGKYLSKNLTEIEGDDAEKYHECFVCRSFGSPGFIRMEPMSPEVIATLNSWLGVKAATELKMDAHSKTCEECEGEGAVQMPSKVQGQESLPCVKCGGLGWLGTDPKRGNFDSPITNGLQPIPEHERGAGAYELVPDGPEPPEVAVLRSQGFMVTKIPTFAS